MKQNTSPRLSDVLARLADWRGAFASGTALLVMDEPAQLAPDVLALPGINRIVEWQIKPRGEHLAIDQAAPDADRIEPPSLILIREPNIIADRSTWHAILPGLARRLRPDGMLIVTTSLLPDAAFINDTLVNAGLTMLPGSPYTPEPVDSAGWDRYILIYEQEADS